MSYTLPDSSPRRPQAQRFGRHLATAMRRRGVGTRPLAAAVGSSRSSIRNWLRGSTMPQPETARRLAAALDTPKLVDIVREARSKTCDVCAEPFLDETGGYNRRFCSEACKKVVGKMRTGVPVKKRAAVAERRLKAYRDAVEAYCLSCEPDRRCVTEDCPLRDVSPFALYESHIDILPVKGRAA